MTAQAPVRRRRLRARLVDVLAGAGTRPPIVAGVQAAVGAGTDRSPWTSLFTIALGLLATIGATAFGSSLEQLTASPPLYGWNWDVRMGGAFSSAPPPPSRRRHPDCPGPGAISLALGLPLGIALGRGVWLRFADGLGVVPVAVVPGLATVGVVVTALVVANLAALISG